MEIKKIEIEIEIERLCWFRLVYKRMAKVTLI
jgi:hypothetical protein